MCAALERIDLAAIALDLGFDCSYFGHQLVDLALHDLLLVVDFNDALGCERRPVAVGHAVGDFSGKFGIDRGEADANGPRFFRRVDFELIAECIQNAVAFALASARTTKTDQPQDGVGHIDRAQRRVELGPVFQFQVVGDFCHQVGRLQRAHMRVDGGRVHFGRYRVGRRRRLRIGERAG